MGRLTQDIPIDPPASETERRGEQRQAISVLINAGLVTGDADGLCRIRNISEQGLMIETRQALLPGQPVRISLRSGKLLGGTVRWVHEGRVGLEMDWPVELAMLNEAPPVDAVERRGIAPAFLRHARALVAIDHRRLRCELNEISLGHARLEGLEGLRPDDVANLTVDGLGTLLAKFRPVRGAEGDSMFALFTQPLHYRLLEEWLEGHAQVASLVPHPAALPQPDSAKPASL